MKRENEARIMYLLQKGLPIALRPYGLLAEQTGDMTENDVLDFILECYRNKTARCLRGVFELKMLGYRSTLCASSVPETELDSVAANLLPEPGITHCYSRDCLQSCACDGESLKTTGQVFNLWFTYTALDESFEDGIAALRQKLSPREVFLFPVVRQFKIQVIFDTRQDRTDSGCDGASPRGSPVSPPEQEFTEKERHLIRALQGFPVTEKPFEQLADQCSYNTDELLKLLDTWQRQGILRRIALIVYHRRVGFSANGMAVWHVPQNLVGKTGLFLAGQGEVSHCYERHPSELFPYNMFAMLHADSWEQLYRTVLRLSGEIQIDRGLLFRSGHEYKKTSFQPFAEK